MVSKTVVGLVAAVVIIIAIAAVLLTAPAGPKPVTTTTTTRTTTVATTPTTTTATRITTTTTPTTITTTTTTTTVATTPATTTTTAPTVTTTTTTTTATTTTTKPPAEKVTLVVLTRHPGDILKVTKDLFLKSDVAKEYGIVNIKFIQEPPGWWVTHIRDRGGVDVAWGGGPTLFDVLYLNNLLRPLESDVIKEALKQVPDTIAGAPTKRVGPDGKVYWVAAAVASFGFTVNHDKLSIYGLPVPKSWRDLGSPEFGRPLLDFGIPAVGIADPTQSTSNTRMYEIILQKYGWDKGWVILTSMAANSQVYQGSGDVRDAVIRGDLAVGITIDFYGYTAHLQNPACEYIIPPGETIVNGDPIAMVTSTKHPEAAQAFIAWVLTEGQKVWLDPDINRLPANPNVFNTPEGSKREDLRKAFEEAARTEGIPFNDTLALMYEEAMRNYFKAVLVDLNSQLKQVWSALLSKYLSGAIDNATFSKYLNELGKPVTYVDPVTGKEVTFTQDDAIRVNEKITKDVALTDKYALAWKQAASKRYQVILSELGA